jgi:hypothetical protein
MEIGIKQQQEPTQIARFLCITPGAPDGTLAVPTTIHFTDVGKQNQLCTLLSIQLFKSSTKTLSACSRYLSQISKAYIRIYLG